MTPSKESFVPPEALENKTPDKTEAKEAKKESREKKYNFPEDVLDYLESLYEGNSSGQVVAKERFKRDMLKDYPGLADNHHLKELHPSLNENFLEILGEMPGYYNIFRSGGFGSKDLREYVRKPVLSSKYNAQIKWLVKGLLDNESNAAMHVFRQLPEDIREEVGGGTTMEDKHTQINKAFDRLFGPLLRLKENKEILEKYNTEKKELSAQLEKINQYRGGTSDQKKKERAPVEARLLELSKLRKAAEGELKEADLLLYLLPDYHKNLESEEEKSVESSGTFDKKTFDQEWIDRNLKNKLEALRKKILPADVWDMVKEIEKEGGTDKIE